MNWESFITAVKEELPVDSARLGTDKFLLWSIRAAAANLQAFLPWLRQGHGTTILPAGFTTDGLAAYAPAPAGVIREVWLKHATADEDRPGSSNRTKLVRRLWASKDAMVAGIDDATGAWVLAPDTLTLWICPHLLDGQSLDIVWDGILDEFLNDTELGANWEQPGVTTAAAEYVRARFQRIIHNNFNAAQLASGEYAKLRQRLYADFKEKALS